jgi:hypothetical protein
MLSETIINEATSMAQTQDRPSRLVMLAYELAQSGKFENTGAVERQIAALGYDEEAYSLQELGVRLMIDEICAMHRDPGGPRWHQHSAY